MNYRKMRNRSAVRILSVLLAVLLCTALSMNVKAASMQETEAEEMETEEEEMTEPTVVEETAETEASTELLVSAEELLKAKEELLALLPEETKAENADVLNNAGWKDTFCREDVLAAVQMNIQALQSGQKLDQKWEDLSRKIQENPYLTEEQQAYYQNQLETRKEEGDVYPSEELFSGLRGMPEEPVFTFEVEAYLLDVTEQAASLDGLAELLDTMESWTGSEKQIDYLSGYLDKEQTGESSAEVQCGALVEQAQQLRDEINRYFEISPKEQQELSGKVRTFSKTVDTFFMSVALDSAKDVAALQEQAGQITRKLLLSYIALGVGVLGVLIGVIAAVMVLMKRPEPTINVATLASRGTVEQLDKQNRRLEEEIRLLDEKVDQLFQQQNQQNENLRKELLAQREAINALTDEIHQVREPVPSNTPRVDVSDPEPVPEKIPQKVGGLMLQYEPISPNSSFLFKSGLAEEYVLYDDDTVEFINSKPETYNRISGWSSKGLFYLFNPELDGCEKDPDRCQQDMDFYAALATVRRAKVRRIQGGNYVLAEKGCVTMKGLER